MDFSLHKGTPTVTVRDNRGLGIREIGYHRHPDTPSTLDERITRYTFNARGQLVQSIDPRLHARHGIDADLKPNYSIHPSLTGEALCTESVDAGTTLALSDAQGRTLLRISAMGVIHRWTYEDSPLPGRLLSISEQTSAEETRVIERLFWSSDTEAAKGQNLAGQCIRHYDTAGCTEVASVGLTGVVLSSMRRLLAEDLEADWQGLDESAWDESMTADTFATSCRADATGTQVSQCDAFGHIRAQTYDVAGQLTSSHLILKDGKIKVVLKSVAYSAAGHKLREEQGNGVVTTYAYEPATLRLMNCKTERLGGARQEPKVFQDLRYEYDPVGNVLSVRNDAEATRFWRNQKIVPINRYRYDSLYQLVVASGREMANITRQHSKPPSPTIPLPANDGAFTNYTRSYHYDCGGNLIRICHRSPASQGNYTLSMTVSDRTNRAVAHNFTEDPATVDCLFDASGNQLQLQPGQPLRWTSRGELAEVVWRTQKAETALQETYRYDAKNQRIAKKHTQHTSTQRVLYLPGLELHTRSNGNALKEALHVILDQTTSVNARLLHWETGVPPGMSNDSVRYSYGNAIDSIGLELDDNGQIISQEEYYAFGGTAVWTARSQVEAAYKTVRYSGKERDATGLYYYGYRYYQPWSGRWLSADPAGAIDGINLYRMVRNNPATLEDGMGLSSKGVYYEYAALKAAPQEIQNTRMEVEAFLQSKRGSAALYVAGGTVREGIGVLAGIGGGVLGSVVPVAGTFAGAYVAKKAAEKALPEFHAVPDTDMAKRLEKKSKGGISHKIKVFREENINLEKIGEKAVDVTANKLVNGVFEAADQAPLPLSVPFSSMYKGTKELLKSQNTSKVDLLQQLAADIETTEALLHGLKATIDAEFGKLSVKREHIDPILGRSGFLEYCVRSKNHPAFENHWIRETVYRKAYDTAMTGLNGLKALVARHKPAAQ
ncbi:MAG: RHS repeat protein [Pseudomonas putida]|jgi:insecticidal toxin complex protein TccC|nr:RHS repeat protein [Pseudomonas putida]